MSTRAWFFAMVGLTCLAAPGCRFWHDKSRADASPLTPPTLAAQSVVVETVFARVTPATRGLEDQLWQELDEQFLPLDPRRRLEANGFRAGLAGMRLPLPLERLLETDDAAATELEAGLLEAAGQRFQLAPGARRQIVTSPPVEHLVVLARSDDGVAGRSYHQAHCEWLVLSRPQDDGRVRLELTPEVHHGENRQRFVPGGGAFRIETGQDREAFGDLQIHVTLAPGQSLVLGATPETKGLGGRFFCRDENGQEVRKVLLVRLAQTNPADPLAE